MNAKRKPILDFGPSGRAAPGAGPLFGKKGPSARAYARSRSVLQLCRNRKKIESTNTIRATGEATASSAKRIYKILRGHELSLTGSTQVRTGACSAKEFSIVAQHIKIPVWWRRGRPPIPPSDCLFSFFLHWHGTTRLKGASAKEKAAGSTGAHARWRLSVSQFTYLMLSCLVS